MYRQIPTRGIVWILGYGGLVALVAIFGWMPLGPETDFHGLAESPSSLWQSLSLAVVLLTLIGSLMARGFRDFIDPVFGPESDAPA